jgi:GAF domain-containing protein
VAAFSNEDITTLRILTDQLANAIESARLLAQAQAHLEEIQAIPREVINHSQKARKEGKGDKGYGKQIKIGNIICVTRDNP